jgi:hypothetical protein
MRTLALLALAVLLAGCGGSSRHASTPSALKDLRSVDELRTEFDAHAGEPRLIMLMSPT